MGRCPSAPGKARAVPAAVAAVASFLRDCCGYKPVPVTEELDENATARKLVEELGGMATIDAMMKAFMEKCAKGDEKCFAFWMSVHEIAMKITGG